MHPVRPWSSVALLAYSRQPGSCCRRVGWLLLPRDGHMRAPISHHHHLLVPLVCRLNTRQLKLRRQPKQRDDRPRNRSREKGLFFKICETRDYVGMFAFPLSCKLHCELVPVHVRLSANRTGIEGPSPWRLSLDPTLPEDNPPTGAKMMRRDSGVADHLFAQ
jgi:hypothetical protein